MEIIANMITNNDEQIQFLELVRDTMSKIKDEIPHLESWPEAKGYLGGSTFVLRQMSRMLPPNLHKDILQYLDSETKLSNGLIDRLTKERLL